MISRTRLLPVALVLAGALAPIAARAVDLNVAGTLQLDYLFTPFRGPDPRPATFALDGFTTEFSLKLAVDLSDHVAGAAKVCFGCHGFEVGMAYVDLRAHDALNLRVGRFSPTFGEFGLRHDPGNHRFSDKPLPYDMGRMLRFFDFGRSVLPAPYVENGVEVFGRHEFGHNLQIDYAAHVVAGLRSLEANPADVDFAASRSTTGFVVDNNSQPSVGGRLGATVRLADRVDLTLGASTLYGAYDRDARLSYLVLGGDLYLRLYRTNLRAEYLIRRTEMDARQPDAFRNEIAPAGSPTPDRIFHVRDGWYVEVEHPLLRNLDVMLRWDGMRRIGNVPTTLPLESAAAVSRWTLGAQVTVLRGWRVKSSLQHYTWTGLRNGVDQEFAAHLGVVATF